MKTIKFFVIGESGVGKSTLIDTYLWKLHFGYAYHDHLMDIRRYHIQPVEITQLEELKNESKRKQYDIAIYLLCFKINDRKSLRAAREKWLPAIRRVNDEAKVFLLALQCDLRDNFAARILQNHVRHSEGLRICCYYENLYYLECSSMKVQSVKDVFDNALEAVLYNDKEAEMRIFKLYNSIRMKLKFDEKLQQ